MVNPQATPFIIGEAPADSPTLRTYRVFALPTQFFLNTDGVIELVLNGPVDEVGATALIESLLPPLPSIEPGSS